MIPEGTRLLLVDQNGKKFIVRPGDCLWIPPDAEHGVKPTGGQTLRFAVVTSPPPWVEVK